MIIGLGGGRTAWYLHKSVPGLSMKAVELDPDVARIAKTYFNIREEPGFDIDIRDGRVWLSRTKDMFDYHPGRCLSRSVRAVPPADDGVLRTG